VSIKLGVLRFAGDLVVPRHSRSPHLAHEHLDEGGGQLPFAAVALDTVTKWSNESESGL
jgi:hypothetical protein